MQELHDSDIFCFLRSYAKHTLEVKVIFGACFKSFTVHKSLIRWGLSAVVIGRSPYDHMALCLLAISR